MNNIYLINDLIEYYMKYKKDFLGKIYDSKNSAFKDYERLLTSDPQNFHNELIQEISEVLMSKNLNNDKNQEQFLSILNIAYHSNKVLFYRQYDKNNMEK